MWLTPWRSENKKIQNKTTAVTDSGELTLAIWYDKNHNIWLWFTFPSKYGGIRFKLN